MPLPFTALAGRIACNPGQALRLTKRLLRESAHVRMETLLEMSAAFQALAHTTPEHEEAVNAMAEMLESKSKTKDGKKD